MSVAPEVLLRDLEGDVALCWIGSDPRGAREMAVAARACDLGDVVDDVATGYQQIRIRVRLFQF